MTNLHNPVSKYWMYMTKAEKNLTATQIKAMLKDMAEGKKMSDYKNINFKIDTVETTYLSYDEFTTLEDAQAKARVKAWNDGKDVGIYGLMAIAKAPAKINDVQVVDASPKS